MVSLGVFYVASDGVCVICEFRNAFFMALFNWFELVSDLPG
jgi:hypothetical protein